MTLLAPAKFIEYDDNAHAYYVDGRKFQSVTQILDAAGFISPFCKDEEARERGTRVHAYTAIDDIEQIDLRKMPDQYRGYIRAWRRYRSETGFTPTLIEHRVDCEEFRYAGRFDRLGKYPGSLQTIIDIKTSKVGAIPKYARLQLVAYGYAMNPTRIFERITVSLKPDGTYNTMPYSLDTYQVDRAEWLSIVRSTQLEKEDTNGHS